MQHPFAGVLKSEQATSDRTVKPANPTTSRRGLFGLLAGVVAVGTFGLLSASKAQAQSTTLMLGEEGGGRRVTTFAVGEEGGGQRVTTLAVGEEGGSQRVTTYAVGEEGGRHPLRVRA